MSQINIRRLTPLFIAICVTSAELIVNEEKPFEATSQCLLDILNEYFKDSKKIAFRCDDDQRQKFVLQQVFKHTNNPITVNAEEHPIGVMIDNRIPSDATIILGENVNITEYLENNLYTARTVFFTVFWGKNEEIWRTFAVFWNYNIVNAYAFEVQKNDVYVYEYIPYANCNMSEPVVLDMWSGSGFRYGRMSKIEKRYPVRQVNGCTLIVTLPHVPPMVIFPDVSKSGGTNVISGIEGRIWTTISEKINSTFRYKTPDDGHLWGFVKPKPTGAVGEVIQKRSHFAGGGPSATVERLVYLDAVIGTSGVSDMVVWAVPAGAGRSQPVWLGMYIIEFSSLTWICLALVLFLTIVTHFLFSRITNTSPTSGLFDSFLILLSASLRGTVKMPQSLALKTLIAFWMWYTLIIMTAYESAMRSALTVPIRRKDINTIQDIVESGIDLYGVDTTIRIVFNDAADQYEKAMAKKVRTLNSTMEEILNRIAKERNVGYMREKLTLDYFIFNHIELMRSIHQARQYMYMYYQTIYMAKRLPVYHTIQNTLSHLRESGIPLWWRSQYTRKTSPSQPKAIKLTTEHMISPFMILGMGTLLAIVAFFAEHVKHKQIKSGTMQHEVP